MLSSVAICFSQYSRNAYSSWKKTGKLHFCGLNRKRTLEGCTSRRLSALAKHSYHWRARLSLLPRCIVVSSTKPFWNTLRNKSRYLQSFVLVPKRYSKRSKQSVEKSITEIMSNTLNILFLKTKFAVSGNLLKLKLRSSQKTSVFRVHPYDFPLFFVKQSSLKSTDASLKKGLPSGECAMNGTVDSKKLPYSEKGHKVADKTIPLSEQQKHGSLENNAKSVENGKTEEKSEVSKSIYSSTEVTQSKLPQSQYDHLVTSLSTRKDTEKLSEEVSLLSWFKSYVEVPINSFFSFMSRASLFEKSNKNESIAASKEICPSAEEEFENADGQEKLQQPTLLEFLYKYIPYTSTPTPENVNDHHILEEKEISRLKAEKELLVQKVNINNRTRYLIQAVLDSNSLFSLCRHVEELRDHLLRFPDTRITAVKENGIKEIMNVYRTTYDQDLLPTLRMTLAMLGAVDPPKKRGIRVLSIDGGGSRGVATVEIFRRLVELTGQPINEMFDYICGVSTGAMLGFGLGILKIPVEEMGTLYRNLSSQIFNQNRIVGTGNLVLSHAYYSTENYQKILKQLYGNQLLIETAAYEDVPKCSAVSTLVNRLPLKPFLWRNYSIVPGTRHTHWNGTCRATMWEAVRASSAAPGYFEEYKKGYNIHQDGGILTNNPTGVALNECRLLWPNSSIQCVVSVGTGRYEPTVGPVGEEFSSLKDKLRKFVDSATSVTEVHTVMYDLLPPGTYFRFNPFIDEPVLLDECRSDKLDMLVENTRDYIRRNDFKFHRCAESLLGHKLKKKAPQFS